MKEFKTVAEQLDILKARGMTVGKEAPATLLRENYYSVINGYKGPFLDRDAMRSSADDVYLEETNFEELFSLFEFDRELRQITFSYLIKAEAALKTATVTRFAKAIDPALTIWTDRRSVQLEIYWSRRPSKETRPLCILGI